MNIKHLIRQIHRGNWIPSQKHITPIKTVILNGLGKPYTEENK